MKHAMPGDQVNHARQRKKAEEVKAGLLGEDPRPEAHLRSDMISMHNERPAGRDSGWRAGGQRLPSKSAAAIATEKAPTTSDAPAID